MRERESDRDLLARVIAASGLSARQWAMTVALRDERTIRRWLAGDSPIPQPVTAYLARIAPNGPRPCATEHNPIT